MVHKPDTDKWSRIGDKLMWRIHKAAHQCWRHKSGNYLIRVWFGFGDRSPHFEWWLLLGDGQPRRNVSSGENPPLEWATIVLKELGAR